MSDFIKIVDTQGNERFYDPKNIVNIQINSGDTVYLLHVSNSLPNDDSLFVTFDNGENVLLTDLILFLNESDATIIIVDPDNNHSELNTYAQLLEFLETAASSAILESDVASTTQSITTSITSYELSTRGQKIQNDEDISLSIVNSSTNSSLVDSSEPVSKEAIAGTVFINTITDDNIINITESSSLITISGTAIGGDISVNDTVLLLINGTTYTTNVLADGSWHVSVNGSDLINELDFKVDVSSTNSSANSISSSVSASFSKDLIEDIISLSLNTDTGSSSSDLLTSDTLINVTGLESDSTWEYSTDGGSTWINGNGTSFNLAQNTSYLQDYVQVRTTDVAGNTSISKMAAITTDNLANDVSLTLNNDTGRDDDFITSDSKINVTGLETGSTWEYSTDGGSTWISGSGTSFNLMTNTVYT